MLIKSRSHHADQFVKIIVVEPLVIRAIALVDGMKLPPNMAALGIEPTSRGRELRTFAS